MVPTKNPLGDDAMVRLRDLVRSPANPIAPLPFSAATLWRKVKAGEFPQPRKFGTCTAWRLGDVRAYLNGGLKWPA